MTVRRKRQDCAIDVRPPLPANAFAWQLRTAAGEIAINGRSSKSLMCKRMFRVQVSADRSANPPPIATPVGAAGRRAVDRRLCIGGPVRDMLMLSGVFSVIVEWCEVSASAA